MAKTPTKSAAKAPLKNTNENYVRFSEDVMEHLECPITRSVIVCPVFAEDGKVYEKSAIERWLSRKKCSPLTRERMGDRLVFSALTRSLVLSAIENDVVDDDAAAAWHLQSAKAIMSGKLAGAPGSVKDHLEHAERLSESPEAKLMLRAVALKTQMDALLKEGAATGVDAVSIVFGDVSAYYGVPMKEFLKLRNGQSKVRIIDDANEFKRLCERRAPGADDNAGWLSCMAGFCGKEFVVVTQCDAQKIYCVLEPGGDDEDVIGIPFDACILVHL